MCNAKFVRVQPGTLLVLYKGKSVADVLDMTVEEAKEFFNISQSRNTVGNFG